MNPSTFSDLMIAQIIVALACGFENSPHETAIAVGHCCNGTPKTTGGIAVRLYSNHAYGDFTVPNWATLACDPTMGHGTLTGGRRAARMFQ